MKKLMSGLAIAAIAASAFVGAASAQGNNTVDSGNGGVSTADSSGGVVSVGSTESGSVTGSTSLINVSEFMTGEDIAAAVIASILAQ